MKRPSNQLTDRRKKINNHCKRRQYSYHFCGFPFCHRTDNNDEFSIAFVFCVLFFSLSLTRFIAILALLLQCEMDLCRCHIFWRCISMHIYTYEMWSIFGSTTGDILQFSRKTILSCFFSVEFIIFYYYLVQQQDRPKWWEDIPLTMLVTGFYTMEYGTCWNDLFLSN